MNTQQAYNSWAQQYDSIQNATRDLEAVALREILTDVKFSKCLEIGCGTGKNTTWLLQHAAHLTAVDFSAEMLAKAKVKIDSPKVQFVQADVLQPWSFAQTTYDLLTFSLVLEHIEHLSPIFEKAAAHLPKGGHVYIGELHPFKQYTGSKARFETEQGTQIVPCFNHHFSDFTMAAAQNGFRLIELKEYFDDHNRAGIPRLLVLLFQKQ